MHLRRCTENAVFAVSNIKIGWNLGNALDCCGLGNVADTGADALAYECQWGNPVVSRKLIRLVGESGYRAVRVPVTYFEHMDEAGTIDPSWIARVQEIIGWVLDEGMYCITNIHHDTGAGIQAWLRADREIFQKEKRRYIRIWEQLAEAFRDYGEKLILEGFNEMLDVASSWDYTTEEGYACINEYNQAFVDTVRRSGGNNRERNLLLNTYGASPLEPAAKAFLLPEDVKGGHLIAGVHFYKPDAFSAGDMERWSEDGEREVDAFFERMERYFLGRNIPVIMGECGTHDIRTEAERVKYVSSVVSKANAKGIAYFWWDDGGSMKLIERNTNRILYPRLQKAMTGGRV